MTVNNDIILFPMLFDPVVIPNSWNFYIPIYISLYIWIFYFIFLCPSVFYRKKEYVKPESEIANSGRCIHNKDITVVIDVLNLAPCFVNCIQSIIKWEPYKILIVTQHEYTKKITDMLPNFTTSGCLIEIIEENIIDQRHVLLATIDKITTKYFILSESNLFLKYPDDKPKIFIENLIAPLDNESVAGVGCLFEYFSFKKLDFKRIIKNMELSNYFTELKASVMWGNTNNFIKRFGCYKSLIFKHENFKNYLKNDQTCKKSCTELMAKYIYNNNYKICYQFDNKTKVLITSEKESEWSIYKILLNSKKNWREKIVNTSHFREKFIAIHKLILPFFMIYSVSYVTYVLVTEKEYSVLFYWLIWLFFNEFIKYPSYFLKYPFGFLLLPIISFIRYIKEFVNIICLLFICYDCSDEHVLVVNYGSQYKIEYKDDKYDNKNKPQVISDSPIVLPIENHNRRSVSVHEIKAADIDKENDNFIFVPHDQQYDAPIEI